MITGYRVDLTQAGQSQASQSQYVSNTSISAQFDSLSPCTYYNISVTTSSRGGETSFYHMETTNSVGKYETVENMINKTKLF